MRFHRWLAITAALVSPVCAANLEITIEPMFNGEPLRLDSMRNSMPLFNLAWKREFF